MKNNVSKLLEHAETSINQHLISQDDNGEIYIPKEYNGYISSFGAAVIQSGLLPALYFNHQKDSDPAKKRRKLMKSIYETIKAGYNIHTDKADLLEYAKQDNVDLKKLKQQILDAATAVKLVIRTYKLK